jgi:predicted MFS family arabinose efflux permease
MSISLFFYYRNLWSGLVFAAVGLTFFTSSLLSGIVLHWVRTWRILIWGGIAGTALLAIMLVITIPLELMIVCVIAFIAVVGAQENTGTIAALRRAGEARGAAMSWNQLAAGMGSLIGIGLGSIGLAVAGVTGLGIAFTAMALCATAVSYIALTSSRYTDEEETWEQARATL